MQSYSHQAATGWALVLSSAIYQFPTTPGCPWHSDIVAVTIYLHKVLPFSYSNLEGLSDLRYPHFYAKQNICFKKNEIECIFFCVDIKISVSYITRVFVFYLKPTEVCSCLLSYCPLIKFQFVAFSLEQGVPNCGPQAKFSLPPVSVDKFLLGHSCAHLFAYCL